MEKEIKITFDENKMSYKLDTKGFTHIEIIGIFEYYKQFYVNLNIKRQKKNK